MKTSFMKLFYTDDYPQASLSVIALFSVLAVLIDCWSRRWVILPRNSSIKIVILRCFRSRLRELRKSSLSQRRLRF